MNIQMNSRIIIITFLILLGSSGFASAYYLNLETPAEVKAGEQIHVQGSTNIPPPEKVDIVLSYSMNIPVEIARQSANITEKGDTLFNVTFNTTGLQKGTYKVEAMAQTVRDFSAGSRSLRIIKIIDRSDLIVFSSPQYQDFDGILQIEARIADYEDKAIQIEVKNGNKTVFGPEPIPVDHGLVAYDLPIKEPGTYYVSFTDYDGLVGTYPMYVKEKSGSIAMQTTPEPTKNETKKQVSPAPTSTPESLNKSVEKNATPVVTVQPVSEESATANETNINVEVSRDNPAYILVTGQKSPVTIRTSPGVDCVVEYKTSSSGAAIKVHEDGKTNQKITIPDEISAISLKVYPYSFKSSEEVEIFATNTDKMELSDKAALAFGQPPRYNKQGSPLPIWICLLAIFGTILLIRRK